MSRDSTGDWLGDADPGGCECSACGRIFIGSEHRSMCRVCADSARDLRKAMGISQDFSDWPHATLMQKAADRIRRTA